MKWRSSRRTLKTPQTKLHRGSFMFICILSFVFVLISNMFIYPSSGGQILHNSTQMYQRVDCLPPRGPHPQRQPGRPQISDAQNHLDLRIRILEDSRADVLSTGGETLFLVSAQWRLEGVLTVSPPLSSEQVSHAEAQVSPGPAGAGLPGPAPVLLPSAVRRRRALRGPDVGPAAAAEASEGGGADGGGDRQERRRLGGEVHHLHPTQGGEHKNMMMMMMMMNSFVLNHFASLLDKHESTGRRRRRRSWTSEVRRV